MSKPSRQLQEFMDHFKIAADEVWAVGDNHCIKHAAIERVASEQGIVFEMPQIATRDFEQGGVSVLVVGRLGDRSEWSFGEASSFNLTRKSDKKPLYPWAMAEKRAKDRVALKLLNVHGALYSEAEADEFERRPNPHVTRPEDIVPSVEYDQQGNPIDNIPLGDETIERMPKSKARADFATCQNEMHATKTVEALDRWGKANANRIASFPTDWQHILRGLYSEHMATLRQGKAA